MVLVGERQHYQEPEPEEIILAKQLLETVLRPALRE